MKKKLTKYSRFMSSGAMYAADVDLQVKRIGEIFSEVKKKGKYI